MQNRKWEKIYFKAFQVCQNQIQLQDFFKYQSGDVIKITNKDGLYHIELLNKYF